MELEKKNIHRNRQNARFVTQVVVDDDYNVPDLKPDAVRILSERANVEIEQKKVLSGRIVLNGTLHFRVLYGTGEEVQKVEMLHGRIPFEETIQAEGIEEKDEVQIRAILDEIQIGLINSRKLGIKALITLVGESVCLCDEEIPSGIREEAQVYTRSEELELLQLLVDKKDILRIKEELELENSYPNIYKILWYDFEPFGVRFRAGDGKLCVDGELQAFVLYQAEDEMRSLQWVTKIFPLHGEVECPGAEELCVEDIRWQLSGQEFTVAQDFDGEDRKIHVEAVLEMHIVLYREEPVAVLKDAYSTVKNLVLEKEELECEQLLLNNRLEVKLNRRLERGEDKAAILQSCHGEGTVKIEQVRQTENGLEIDGTATVTVLYITADDAMPVDSLTEKIPFSRVVEVPEITPDCRVVVRPRVDGIEIATAASSQLDVKLMIGVHLMILCKPKAEVVRSIEEEPLDLERIREMPGVTGRIVKEGETLWEIAREMMTTEENIKEVNQLQSGELTKGQKLIIIKNIEQKGL